MVNLKKENGNYSEIININGIDVPYNKSSNNDSLIYAEPTQLFKAAIEGSVHQNLNIINYSSYDEECVKNLYRMILTCGEYETPYIDENVLEEYLKNEQNVINLVRKFPEINKIHFNNKLGYLTFSLDDEIVLKKYIEILRKSFKNNQKNN